MLYNSYIFESLVKEYEEKRCEIPDQMETREIDLSEGRLNGAKCSIAAYGLEHLKENLHYDIEKNPERAVLITFEFPEGEKCEIFLETKTGEWSSSINGNPEERLSPDQMGKIFKSKLFHDIQEKLYSIWDRRDEDPYSRLKDCLRNKRCKTEFEDIYRREQNDGKFGELNEWEITRRKVKFGIPNEKDANGNKIRSSSGRKLVHYTDMGVSKDEEAYYSWPGGTDDKHIFKWSRWNNWENQKPFLRARFSYPVAGGAAGLDVIGCSLSLTDVDDKNRGWFSYNLSLEPVLQYNTPEETQDILKLSIMRRFMKECLNRITPILNTPDEEIYKRINKPDKCTLDDIRKTKSVIRNTLKAVRDPRANTFVYT